MTFQPATLTDNSKLCRKLFVLDFDLWPCEMFSQYRVQGFMISFKGSHYPKDVILHAVFFYIRYAVSYRDLEEILAERGVEIDHATLNRWVVKYSPLVAEQAHRRKSKTCASWRVDETYIRVKGKWVYQYRAIDKHGKTLDFMLSERRDEAAARAFFIRSIANNGLPEKVVIDKSGSNLAGLNTINCCLFLCGFWPLINVLRVKYLNNIVEQDHRFIRKLTRPTKGFKSFHSASATLQGIEVAHMIHKQQFGMEANPVSNSLQLSQNNCVRRLKPTYPNQKFATEP